MSAQPAWPMEKLVELSTRLNELGVASVIERHPGDVPFVHVSGRYEVVNVDGTYDVWEHGLGIPFGTRPVEMSLPIERAAQYLINDNKKEKGK